MAVIGFCSNGQPWIAEPHLDIKTFDFTYIFPVDHQQITCMIEVFVFALACTFLDVFLWGNKITHLPTYSHI